MQEIERTDVPIVGGGIAGLVAATYAARGGRSVAIFERSEAPGGRARTTRVGGFELNLGAHAQSVRGANAPILDELGIMVAGARPEAGRFRAMRGGQLHALPTSGLTLASTRLLGLRAKVEFGRFYASMGGVDPRDHVARFVAGVLARGARDPDSGRPEFTEVNGQFGLLWRDRAGTPTDVVVVEVADGVVTAILAIRNPDKLARFA